MIAAFSGAVTSMKASCLRISNILLDVPAETLDLALPDRMMATLRVVVVNEQMPWDG
jgi:hypothetical protein